MRHSHPNVGNADDVVVRSFEEAQPLVDFAQVSRRGSLLALLLDEGGRFVDLLSFDEGDKDPVRAMHALCEPTEPGFAAVVLASCRGSRSPLRRRDADVALWDELSALAFAHGVRLLDWFIVGRDLIFVPRELSEFGHEW